MADFAAGEYGEIAPDSGENRLTARNRLKAAARRRGVTLTFLRTTGDTMRFKVDEKPGAGQQPSEPEPAPPPVLVPVASDVPPKRRGGRPKKQP